MADEWVRMSHPDVPKSQEEPAKATRRAFELSHKAKGWKIVAEGETATEPVATETLDSGDTPEEPAPEPVTTETLDAGDTPAEPVATAEAEPTSTRRRSTKEGS